MENNAFTQNISAAGVRDSVSTYNGAATLPSSGKSVVDLFFTVGASRGRDISPVFQSALVESHELALRTLLWARDVRGGAGERQTFRNLLVFLENNNPELLKHVLPRVAELGRFDDLLVLENAGKNEAFKLIKDALLPAGYTGPNSLCAKWMPRKGAKAVELRNFLELSPKQYRKLLVRLTNVVETPMCNKEWDHIVYDHVPSVASARYRKAFLKHDNERYKEYIGTILKQQKDISEGKVVKPEELRVIHADAVFPHDIIHRLLSEYSSYVYRHKEKNIDADEKNAILAQWQALPDFVGEGSFLPMVDVSGSMTSWGYYTNPQGKVPTVNPIDVAVSLGLYLSERNKSVFKDVFLTFSTHPVLQKLQGNVIEKCNQLVRAQWDGSTNLEAAFRLILQHAVTNNVSQKDMPQKLLILSDMEFDGCTNSKSTNYETFKVLYHNAGYELPEVVFWNLNGRAGNVPVTFDTKGAALVSGFSPTIVKNLLSNAGLNPLDFILDTILNPRYDLANLPVT